MRRLVLAALLVASPAFAAEQVNVYSARHYDADIKLFELFTKETGIKVNVVEDEADKLIQRIKAEGANSPADLFITVDAGRLWRAQEANVLQPVRSEKLEKLVPAQLREPGGLWYGLTKRVRIVMVNKDKVQPNEITRYEDLADPKWKGRICVRSSNAVYNQSLVGSMIAADGMAATEKWAKALVANLAKPPRGGDIDQILSVAAGECDVTLANNYYLARLIHSSKPSESEPAKKIAVVFPNQADRGTHSNISGAGVVRSAPHKDNAVKLLEFLASDEAQKLVADENYEYPIREGLPVQVTLAGWGQFKSDAMNAALFGRNNADALKLMDRAGWR
ncbi:Fe(3+) ABC transporter substrate-binding protein [Roseiterribacter gracilis]|uniref:Iron deficiency-induced protein A n=1 Tax=Roseiterribacter gracilis TaxID=2812848 RepID=A0A8S8XB86_9PROT|nr:iron deficiency-induced protein A [Rhodospirillales bacterium TMPK1]